MSKSRTAIKRGEQLVKELLKNPAAFEREGKSYQLLQQYFHGFPIETLRALLTHTDVVVRRAGMWIASELAAKACSLIDDIVRLLDDRDRRVRYYALETVMVCSKETNLGKIAYVVAALESPDPVIRVLAMFLLTNANASQLKAARKRSASGGATAKLHRRGIATLLASDTRRPTQIPAMVDDKEPLIKRYGAIAAERVWSKRPELIETAADSTDNDVRKFAEQMLRRHKSGTKR